MGAKVVILSVTVLVSAIIVGLFFFGSPLIVIGAIFSGALIGRSYSTIRKATLVSILVGFFTPVAFLVPILVVGSLGVGSLGVSALTANLVAAIITGLLVALLTALPANVAMWLIHRRGQEHYATVSLLLTSVLVVASVVTVYYVAIATQASQAAFNSETRTVSSTYSSTSAISLATTTRSSSTSSSLSSSFSSTTTNRSSSQSSPITATIPANLPVGPTLEATCQGGGLPSAHGTLSFANATNAVVIAFSLTYGGSTYDFPRSRLGGCATFPGNPINVYITALPVAPFRGSAFTGYIVLQDQSKIPFSGDFT